MLFTDGLVEGRDRRRRATRLGERRLDELSPSCAPAARAAGPLLDALIAEVAAAQRRRATDDVAVVLARPGPTGSDADTAAAPAARWPFVAPGRRSSSLLVCRSPSSLLVPAVRRAVTGRRPGVRHLTRSRADLTRRRRPGDRLPRLRPDQRREFLEPYSTGRAASRPRRGSRPPPPRTTSRARATGSVAPAPATPGARDVADPGDRARPRRGGPTTVPRDARQGAVRRRPRRARRLQQRRWTQPSARPVDDAASATTLLFGFASASARADRCGRLTWAGAAALGRRAARARSAPRSSGSRAATSTPPGRRATGPGEIGAWPSDVGCDADRQSTPARARAARRGAGSWSRSRPRTCAGPTPSSSSSPTSPRTTCRSRCARSPASASCWSAATRASSTSGASSTSSSPSTAPSGCSSSSTTCWRSPGSAGSRSDLAEVDLRGRAGRRRCANLDALIEEAGAEVDRRPAARRSRGEQPARRSCSRT